jgi:hypothetical protein
MRYIDKGIGSGFVRVTVSRIAGIAGLFKSLNNLFDFIRGSRNYMCTMKKRSKEKNAIGKQTENAGVEIPFEFYANLKKAVADTGISAWALEKKFGRHKQFLSNILRGDRDPKFSSIVRIVKGMRLSIDGLLGSGLQTEAAHPQSVSLAQAVSVPSGVEIKKISADFAEKVAQMHENDVELLEAIAGILLERKSRVMARFLHAIQDTERGNPAGKAKTGRPAAKGTLSGGSDSGFRDRFGNGGRDGDTDTDSIEREDFKDDDDFDFDDDDFELDDDDDDDFDFDDDDDEFFDD